MSALNPAMLGIILQSALWKR